jgi:hypothetical protein
MATLFIAAAPFTLGGLVGFLFGIPKTLVQPDDAPNGIHRSWQANTSLEQISDWLTKILLGIGLTQLTLIPRELQETGEYLSESLATGASPAVLAALIVAFAIGGFVIGFLLTRFDLGEAIDRQDGVLKSLEGAILENPSDRRAVLSYVFTSLYASPPNGFENAISQANAFLGRMKRASTESSEDGELYYYLACAYGQKYAFLRASKANQRSLQETARLAASAIESALSISDSMWRSRLLLLADPSEGSVDNDLELVASESPDVRAALGLPVKA